MQQSPQSEAAEPSVERGPEVVRRLLIEAASYEMADRNPNDVTGKQIAERAGVNHGQIHHCFGSKDLLIAEVLRKRAADIAELGRSGIVPIDAHNRTEVWRAVAHMSSAAEWSQSDEGTPNWLLSIIERHAAVTNRRSASSDVVAEVAAAQSLGIGWWIYEDMLIEGLREFDVDRSQLCDEIETRSLRMLDAQCDFKGAKPTRAMPDPVATRSIVGPPRAPRGRDEVSARLIEAAVSLLNDRPAIDVTNNEIARLAGVNHGQIHHYFDSKEHLLFEAVRHEGRAASRGSEFPLPLMPEYRHPLWRTLNHLAATDDWGIQLARRSPLTREMVRFLAENLGLDVSDPRVHGQVAAIQALELGWGTSKDRVDSAIEHFGVDREAAYLKLAHISCRLVDHEALAT